MAPTLGDGAWVRVRGGGAGPSAVDSAIAFLAGGRDLTIHRLIFGPADSRYVLTRGDGNLLCDPPVPRTDVLGRVVQVRQGSDEWVDLTGPDGSPGLLTRWHEATMQRALAVHVRLAQFVALLGLGILLPVVLLRRGFSARLPPYFVMFRLARSGEE